MTTLIEKLEEANNRFQANRAKMQEEARVLIRTAFESIFVEFPDIKAITWVQYTPFFNDGGACTFDVHEPYLLGSDNSEETGVGWCAEENALETCSYSDKVAPYTHLRNIEVALSKFLQSNEDVLKSMFGDHVSVFVTAKGVEVNRYDHD